MDLKSRPYKPEQKQRQKHYLYHKRSNYFYPHLTKPGGQRYLLELNTMADNSKSLIDIFLHFFPTIFEGQPENQHEEGTKKRRFNLYFQYMVELYHLHDQYIPLNVKKTEEQSLNTFEILGNLSLDEQLKKDVLELNKKAKEFIEKQISNMMKTHDPITRVRLIKANLKKKYQEAILSIEDKSKRIVYIPQNMEQISQAYVKKMLTTIHNLQFTKRKYRTFRMQDFITKYADFWNVVVPEQKSNKQNKKLMIKRYTLVKDPGNYHQEQVLIHLNNLIKIKNEHDCKNQYLELMKELGKELLRHKKLTKNYYPLLHPKNIILNQISLQVNLSYQPILLSTLGLLKTPTSIQQSICFSATPQAYDPFSAPNQHLTKAEELAGGTGNQIFYDMLYGMDDLLDAYDPRCKAENKTFLILNGLTMSEIKQEHEKRSQAWRYTMILSYLLSGSEYHKKFLSSTSNYEQFLHFLQGEQSKYENGNHLKYIKSVLQPKSQKVILDEVKQFSLSIFHSFIGEQPQDSQMTAPSRLYKYERLLKQKRHLQNDFIEIILKPKLNGKMYNSTKYLILFYLSLFESMFQLKLICEYYLENKSISREFLRELAEKVNMKDSDNLLDKNSYVEISFAKFLQYEEKNKRKPVEQLKYLHRCYEKIYKSVDGYRSIYNDLKQKFKKEIYNIQPANTEQIYARFNQMRQETLPVIGACQSIVTELIQKEYRLLDEVVSQQQINTKKFNCSTHLKLRLFLYVTQENFLTLDSLIFPLLSLQKEIKSNPSEQPSIEVYQYALQVLKEYETKYDYQSQLFASSSKQYSSK